MPNPGRQPTGKGVGHRTKGGTGSASAVKSNLETFLDLSLGLFSFSHSL